MKGKGILDRKGTDKTVRKQERKRATGRDPFNQNSKRFDRGKRTTSKGGPVFSKLFWLDRTDPLSFGPKFPESLVEWIAPSSSLSLLLSNCFVRSFSI